MAKMTRHGMSQSRSRPCGHPGGSYLVVERSGNLLGRPGWLLHLVETFSLFLARAHVGEARAHVIWAKWPKMAYLSVVLGHPGTPRAHTWWLERSATLLTRSRWLLHLINVFAIFGVFSTCPRGCLSEKVEKIEKKWNFLLLLFFDQKDVQKWH